MINLYEAGETLAKVETLLSTAGTKRIIQTPDGRDPVFWPITIHGQTGMMTVTPHSQDEREDTAPKKI